VLLSNPKVLVFLGVIAPWTMSQDRARKCGLLGSTNGTRMAITLRTPALWGWRAAPEKTLQEKSAARRGRRRIDIDAHGPARDQF